MEKITIPNYVPLTRLASVEEKQVRSSRGLVMQQALKQASEIEMAAKSKKKGNSDTTIVQPHIGMKAYVEAYEKQCLEKGVEFNIGGTQAKKGGKKKDSDETAAATAEVMKAGKHLLK